MTLFQIIILSIIESVTEFLPVSSTAHLIIGQKLFGLSAPNEFITTILQFSAICAAVWYFRRRIFELFIISKDRFNSKKYIQMPILWYGVATLPILLVAYIVKDYIKILQNNLFVIVFTTFFGGIFFYVVERKYIRPISNNISMKSVITSGVFQIIGLIPGSSRSGMTISGSLFNGVSMRKSIESAFIMGIPAITVASVYEFLKVYKTGLDSTPVSYILVGVIITFILSMFSIKFTLGVLESKGFKVFMYYRIILALVLLILIISGYIK